MSNIKEFVDYLEDDKKDHVIVGQIYSIPIFPISVIVLFIGGVIPMFVFATICFGFGTYFNVYKEVYHDWYKKKGNAEWGDFLATQIPLLTSYLPYLIILWIELRT